jgi:hypothetical protein
MGRFKLQHERGVTVEKEKQVYMMANLVYGQIYPEFWLDNQLKSLLDSSNLPALKEKYKLEYALFTDDETLMRITRHPNFMQLSAIAEIHVIKMNWPADADRFGSRYQLLVQMFHQMIQVALERKAWLSIWVADLVFAKRSLPTMLSHLEAGFDGVLMVPIRGAADSINMQLARLPGAPTDLELFELAYRNLHHLWVASHWDAGLFSKFPYSMLWNSGSGLCTHHFGITPIVFKPNEAMRGVQGVIDADVPGFLHNPYWCENWTDAAVAGIEPLSNGHYPPFLMHKASEDFVVDWATKGTMPSQTKFLHKALYYPTKSVFNNGYLADRAQQTTEQIQKRLFAQTAAVPAVKPAAVPEKVNA